MKKGQMVTYTKEFMFGKTATVTAKVVMVKGLRALLDNGDEILITK